MTRADGIRRPCTGRVAALSVVLVALVAGCAARPPAPTPVPVRKALPLLGYTIQVGAFSVFDNAVRLTEALQAGGQDATFFRDTDGLYKVRFGSFPTREAARQRAEHLRLRGDIDVFYIVAPGQQTAAERRSRGDAYIRERIVHTAHSFIGLPYRWGGESVQTGFDCSGLTMTAYRLNGFELPRNSRAQFVAGDPVSRSRLDKGDLVFFAIADKKTVSHVGIYIGDGRFIHAPGKGKTIRIDALSNGYYRRHYVGGRTYL